MSTNEHHETDTVSVSQCATVQNGQPEFVPDAAYIRRMKHLINVESYPERLLEPGYSLGNERD